MGLRLRVWLWLCFVVLLGAGLVGCQRQVVPDNEQSQVTASPVVGQEQTSFEPFTARFEIYTQGTKRVFTAAMYHNLSSDVYLTADDPSVVYVAKDGVRWTDLFATLPMELTKDCLVTGTKQTFCTGEQGQLRFFVNGVEDPEALSREVGVGDELRVTYE